MTRVIIEDPTSVCRGVRVTLVAFVLGAFVSGCATAAKTPEESPAVESAAKVDEAIAAGDAAARGGDHERAQFEYLRALIADERNQAALLRVADLDSADSKFGPAEEAYRRLLAINDRHARGQEGLGLLMLRTSRLEQAKEYLSLAVKLDATLWRAENGLGVISDLQGHPDLAAPHYNVALKLRPDEPMLLNNVGYSRYLAGDWPAAELYFRNALAKDPDDAYAWSNLGLVAARRGHYDQALDALKRVGSEAQAYNNLGFICLLQGDYPAAERFLREAVRLSPAYFKAAQDNLSLLRTKQARK